MTYGLTCRLDGFLLLSPFLLFTDDLVAGSLEGWTAMADERNDDSSAG
jgi:hypothetical protein